MVKIIQLLFAFLAYVSVATMISIALGVGYLWHNDRLSDEKLFRLVALLQDVDMQQIGQGQGISSDEVPPEEPSLDDVLHHQAIRDRNFEVKLLALQRGKQEYDDRLQQLKVQTDRYDRMAQEWQSRLEKEEELTTQENLAKVVSQLEQLRPPVAKDLLLRWIEEQRMDDAILLMSKMSENKLSKILKAFETPEELNHLHEIHQRIIGGGAGTEQLQQALGAVKPPVNGPTSSNNAGANP
jgi:hypothetical protein